MSWSRIAEFWDDLIDQIVGRYPEMDPVVLRAASGAPDRVAEHLATSHHLTLAEAHEELEHWRDSLARRG